MIYRYEVNKQVGIFHVLTELEEAMQENASIEEQQELADAEEAIERELPCLTDMGVSTVSWFTEKGSEKFYDEIQTIIYYIGLYLGITVTKRETITNNSPVVYEDEYQIAYLSRERR